MGMLGYFTGPLSSTRTAFFAISRDVPCSLTTRRRASCLIPADVVLSSGWCWAGSWIAVRSEQERAKRARMTRCCVVGAHLVVVSSRPRQGRILLLSFGCARKRCEAVQPGDVLVDIFALCVRVLRTLKVRFWVHRHGVGMTWNGDLQSTNRACNLVI